MKPPRPRPRRLPPTAPAALRLQQEQIEQRVFDALRRMRTGASLTRAVRDAHTTPDTVRKYAGSVVERMPNNRYRAKSGDRFVRTLRFPTADGVISLRVQGSRKASQVARYWAAVDRYLTTGETDALRPFEGETLRLRGARHAFITDPATLDRLANAGQVSFEDLYAVVT